MFVCNVKGKKQKNKVLLISDSLGLPDPSVIVIVPRVDGDAHIIQRWGSEQNADNAWEASCCEKPQKQSVKNHRDVFPVLDDLFQEWEEKGREYPKNLPAEIAYIHLICFRLLAVFSQLFCIWDQ